MLDNQTDIDYTIKDVNFTKWNIECNTELLYRAVEFNNHEINVIWSETILNLLLGNHRIYEIVQQGFYELRIDMADFNSERRYALYKRFYIGDEASGYRLHLEDYEGTAGINFF